MPVKTGRWWLTQDGHQIVINATPERIYNLVADLPRMGEWSPECKRVDWADCIHDAGGRSQVRRTQSGRTIQPVPLVAPRPSPCR